MTRTEKIEEFLMKLDTEVVVLNHVDPAEVNDYGDIYTQIEDSGGFDIEVIFYSKAMSILYEHDPSLQESLNLAADMGFEPQNLNSEILASLLCSRDARLEFEELQPEIDAFFEDLDNTDFCEECDEECGYGEDLCEDCREENE